MVEVRVVTAVIFPPDLKRIQPPAPPHMLPLPPSAGVRFDARVGAWLSGLGQCFFLKQQRPVQPVGPALAP